MVDVEICVLFADDIMHGIDLVTCSAPLVRPSLHLLKRVPSSEGLEDYELGQLAEQVTKEVDAENTGLAYHDFRGILTRMPDFMSNFLITI